METKDNRGQSVQIGDLLLTCVGTDKDNNYLMIWEFEEDDGDGITYNFKGERVKVRWRWAKESVKIEKRMLSNEQLINFYKGINIIVIKK